MFRRVRLDNRQQFSSVQDGIFALEKPICAPPGLSEVSPTLPLSGSNVRLTDDGPLSSFQRSSSVLSKIVFPRLSPPVGPRHQTANDAGWLHGPNSKHWFTTSFPQRKRCSECTCAWEPLYGYILSYSNGL